MATAHFNLVVIGSGPGGEGAAMKAAKEGRKVAVIERHVRVGGGCTHWGTIPSKALRHAIQTMVDFGNHPLARKIGRTPQLSLAELVATAQSVISRQSSMRQAFYDRNGVEVLEGTARFADPHRLTIDGPRSPYDEVTADGVIIAVGSRPHRPAGVDFSHPRIFDSDTILSLRQTPQSMTVYGAGVIGCEWASMFRAMGIKINLVNTRDRLLSFLDDEITDALSYHLRDMGTLIRHNEELERVVGHDDSVVLHLKSGKALRTDVLLYANGRSGNTDSLGLEQIGLTPDSRGNVQVNEHYQTALPHIYAVGDVAGPPALASAAYDQGRFAATHFCEGHCDLKLVRDIPTGIYTTPEISSIGRTERELTRDQVPYEVGHSLFKSLARAQITGQTVGMLKLLFHRRSMEILGIHCFGANASEIIHIGQAVMCQAPPNNTLMYFVNTTFNYPTMAEAYRVAALNGLNRVFDD